MKKKNREIELYADLERERATSAARLCSINELQQQNAVMISLVADIRFALGDDGKRMQGELVEYCKELRRDAERLRFCQRDPEKGDFAVCKWDWDNLSWMPTDTDVIDAAMQTQAPDGA